MEFKKWKELKEAGVLRAAGTPEADAQEMIRRLHNAIHSINEALPYLKMGNWKDLWRKSYSVAADMQGLLGHIDPKSANEPMTYYPPK